MSRSEPDRAFSPMLLRFFLRTMRSFVRKNTHAVRLSKNGDLPALGSDPTIVFLNHASWWDPLICLVLAYELFPDRRHFAPIDTEMLEKYKFMKKIGFFGVDRTTRRGVQEFLETTDALLALDHGTLWITASGRFMDPRERPVTFQPGIGHVAKRMGRGCLLPLAIEYPFWDERYPEVVCRFGEIMNRDEARQQSSRDWTARLERSLEKTQDALAEEAILRKVDDYRIVLAGRVGIGGVYDIWRSLRARLTGKSFHAGHGGPES